MSYAIRIHEIGGPEVLRLEQVEVSVVPGSDRNIKITKPTDMDLARLYLAHEAAARKAS